MRMTALLLAIAAALSCGVPVFGAASSARSVADPRVVPQTMLAAAIDKGGGPEVLSIHHLPVPQPEPGEVLIAVHGAGVAVWEVGIRQQLGDLSAHPVVLGGDGAGTVVAVGPDVRRFRVGDEVYGTGGRYYAEYATAKVEHIAHIPKGIGLNEASILAISGLSALQGIDDVLQMKAGQTLIVHGAAGGVGTLAVQFAKLRGVRVLATASDAAGLALASKLGADAVVNGRTGDILAAARAFAPNGVDAVLGLAGGDPLEHCIDALRRDGPGRVAYLYGVEPTPRPRGAIRMTLYNFVSGILEFERLNKAVKVAKLQVPIAAEYSLGAAAEAHKRLEAGHLLGKIVLLAH